MSCSVTFLRLPTLYIGGMTMNATISAFANRSAEQPDEDVIRQVLDGNTAMFELLMRRYNERVYRAARAIVRDEQEAEDVMQQAYVNAFTHLRQFNGAARFSTWLTRIAVNESLARVRRRRPACGRAAGLARLARRRALSGRQHSRVLAAVSPGTPGRALAHGRDRGCIPPPPQPRRWDRDLGPAW